MARALKNRRVSLTGNQAPVNREEFAPTDIAVETENARLGVIGTFRVDNLAINQAGVALARGAVDANAPTSQVAPRAGKIVGFAVSASAAITAGVATIAATIAGTAVGVATSIRDVTGAVFDLATPVAFAEGAKVGVKITTDANILPAGSVEVTVDVLVRWDP